MSTKLVNIVALATGLAVLLMGGLATDWKAHPLVYLVVAAIVTGAIVKGGRAAIDDSLRDKAQGIDRRWR